MRHVSIILAALIVVFGFAVASAQFQVPGGEVPLVNVEGLIDGDKIPLQQFSVVSVLNE